MGWSEFLDECSVICLIVVLEEELFFFDSWEKIWNFVKEEMMLVS